MADKEPVILITSEFRMSYPESLIKPQQYKGKGPYRYSVEMLFEPDALTRFKRPNPDTGEFEDVDVRSICAEVAKQQWPGINVKEAVENNELRWPIIKGDKKAEKREQNNKRSDYYKGMEIITAKTGEEFPPRLYYVEGGKVKQITRGMDSEEAKAKQMFAGGNYGYAEVNIKAMEVDEKKHVTFYVNSVRYTREGERIGGMSMMDRFEGVQGGVSDHDPTEGDDDIPI